MSVCHIYLVPLVVLYVFRIRDDKEVKGDEDEAHTVCCDDERSTVLRFSAFVFKRQVSVSCRYPVIPVHAESIFVYSPLIFFKELE